MYDWDAGKLGFGLVGIVIGLVTILTMFVMGCIKLTILTIRAVQAWRASHA